MIFLIGWLIIGSLIGLCMCYLHDEDDSIALGEAMIACLIAWPLVALAALFSGLSEIIAYVKKRNKA